MRLIFSIICVFCCENLMFSQTYEIDTIAFSLLYGKQKLQTEHYYKNGDDSVLIETLKFYISGIELLDKDRVVWQEKNSFHLIDISNERTLNISCLVPANIQFTQLKLNLGIDSTTNVSGALGGDLDPTKGMYWAWQSGYINFKLEGKSNLCKTRGNEFQLHLGGYQFPFNGLKTVTFNLINKDKTTITLDIEQLLNAFNLSQQNHIMSPKAEAVLFSEIVSKLFSVKK
jgi:hypothetical protein